MSYTVTRHADATTMLAVVEPFLLQREALNSLILGAARAQQRDMRPAPRRRPSLYLTVHGPAGPALVAVSLAGRRLLLADGGLAADIALDALIDNLCATPRLLPAIYAEERLARRFVEKWTARTGQTVLRVERQRLFQATAIILPDDSPPGYLRPATVRERDLLAGWLLDLPGNGGSRDADDQQTAGVLVDGLLARKDLFVWDAGDQAGPRPVAMAARGRTTGRGIAINLVYTPPKARGLGYATACVAHLSNLLLESDWQFCMLLVTEDNTDAEVVYDRIGHQPIAVLAAVVLSLTE